MSQFPVVPFVDLKQRFINSEKDLIEIFQRIGRSGAYVMGSDITAFEEEAAAYCGTKYAIAVANGTDALILSMKALGIGQGDEVITTPNSFIATAGSIAATGATIRFVDVCDDLNMDPKLIEAEITPNTKAVIPVHLTGRPVDMDPVNEIAKRHNLAVIEDAAQAIGARYHGRAVGSLGDIAGFSLHPLKNLHVYGDGGFLTTDRKELNYTIRGLRNHGLVDRDTCLQWGYNSRLDNLHAAFARYQLKDLDVWNLRFRKIAEAYRAGLANVVEAPTEQAHEYCVYHNFVLLADRRDDLMAFLNTRGIESKIHYPILLHMQPAAKDLGYSEGDFPRSEDLVKRMLSLPIYPELTDDQVAYVIATITEFYNL